jgi:hypothetical protein
MPVLLATREAEIKRIKVQRQSGKNSLQDPISKNPSQKIGLVEWLKVKALTQILQKNKKQNQKTSKLQSSK